MEKKLMLEIFSIEKRIFLRFSLFMSEKNSNFAARIQPKHNCVCLLSVLRAAPARVKQRW